MDLKISLEVKAEEIVGIAGVEGNGQNMELVEAITGMRIAKGGKVYYKNEDITNMRQMSLLLGLTRE